MPNKEMQKLGALIKKAREDAGLTQQELGASLKPSCTGAKISKIESGNSKIDALELEQIAQALGKDTSYFYSDAEDPSHKRPLGVILREAQAAYEAEKRIQFEKLDVMEIPVTGIVPSGRKTSFRKQLCDSAIYIPKVLLPTDRKDYYALTVDGDSLIGDGIQSGDYVVIEPNAEIIEGKLYIIKIESETISRHVRVRNNKAIMTSSDCDFAEMEIDKMEILGRIRLSGRYQQH
jgi:SOS-response transcriptional repressor LexA